MFLLIDKKTACEMLFSLSINGIVTIPLINNTIHSRIPLYPLESAETAPICTELGCQRELTTQFTTRKGGRQRRKLILQN